MAQGAAVQLQPALTFSLNLNKPDLVFKCPYPYLPNELAGPWELLVPLSFSRPGASLIYNCPMVGAGEDFIQPARRCQPALLSPQPKS